MERVNNDIAGHAMKRQQLELGFDDRTRFTPTVVNRQRRLSRAQWWFAQMHRVVDAAVEWRPTPPARPHQQHLALRPSQARG